MKTVVILGVGTNGVRTTKTIKTTNVSEVINNPNKYNLAKISAVMTEKSFNQAMES